MNEVDDLDGIDFPGAPFEIPLYGFGSLCICFLVIPVEDAYIRGIVPNEPMKAI